MKILHVDERFTIQGGVGRYVMELITLLRDQGHESVLICGSSATPRDVDCVGYALPNDAQAAVEAMSAIANRECAEVALVQQPSSARLLRSIAQLLPTVVFAQSFSAVCPGLAKYYRKGDRVCEQRFDWRCLLVNYAMRCCSARSPLTMMRLMQSAHDIKAAHLYASHTLVASDYMRALLAQNGFDRDRVSVLPCHFVASDRVPAYAPPEEKTTVLYSGRLELEKGLAYLIRAVALLPDAVRLVVAGDGTQRRSCELVARSLAMQNRVHFVGWQTPSELALLYQRCTMVVVPSLCPEPFGKVGVEAMVYGRPAVAYDVGGIRDWLVDGVTGILVRPHDVAGMARAMDALLCDPSACERMGRASQAYVLEHFGADDHAQRMLAILTDAILSWRT